MNEQIEPASWLIDRDGSAFEIPADSESGDGEGKSRADKDAQPENGTRNKEDRLRMLRDDALELERKAHEPDIDAESTVGQAFAAIVQECVRHFQLNQPLIVAERDPDALHQSRVAMRRLRTALRLFRPAIRQATIKPLKHELREFLRPFGTARNLDVYLARHGDQLGWRDQHKLKSARSKSYEQIVHSLKAERTTDMIARLLEWVATGDWPRPVTEEMIGGFASRRLDRAWKKVRAGAAHLGQLREKQLHRLRIDIKELRYSVEFLAPLHRRNKVDKFAATLEAMQDCLGLMHDDIISREIVADFELDRMGHADVAAHSRQLKRLAKRFKRLKKAGPYWR